MKKNEIKRKYLLLLIETFLLIGAIIFYTVKINGYELTSPQNQNNMHEVLEKARTIEVLNGEYAPSMPCDGYIYVGWNTKKDGSGIYYYPGHEVDSEKEAVTLYAIPSAILISEIYTPSCIDVEKYKEQYGEFENNKFNYSVCTKNEIFNYIQNGVVDEIKNNKMTFETWLKKKTNAKTYLLALNTKDNEYGTLKNRLEITSGLNIKTIEDIFNGKQKYEVAPITKEMNVCSSYNVSYLIGISEKTFYQNNEISKVSLAPSVRFIENNAFSNCTNLSDITLSIDLLTLGDSVFSGCDSLTAVNYMGTMNEWNSIQKGNWNKDSSISTIICSDGNISL